MKTNLNDVVIAVQTSAYAPENVVTGFIYKFIDNGEWAEIMDDHGQIKLVEVANIREVLATADEVNANKSIGISSPRVRDTEQDDVPVDAHTEAVEEYDAEKDDRDPEFKEVDYRVLYEQEKASHDNLRANIMRVMEELR